MKKNVLKEKMKEILKKQKYKRMKWWMKNGNRYEE